MNGIMRYHAYFLPPPLASISNDEVKGLVNLIVDDTIVVYNTIMTQV